jgi:hypothetical protein
MREYLQADQDQNRPNTDSCFRYLSGDYNTHMKAPQLPSGSAWHGLALKQRTRSTKVSKKLTNITATSFQVQGRGITERGSIIVL